MPSFMNQGPCRAPLHKPCNQWELSRKTIMESLILIVCEIVKLLWLLHDICSDDIHTVFTQCPDCGVRPRLLPLSVNANHLPWLPFGSCTCHEVATSLINLQFFFLGALTWWLYAKMCLRHNPGLYTKPKAYQICCWSKRRIPVQKLMMAKSYHWW